MSRVLINGAKGKMGSMAAAFVDADPLLELVGRADAGDDLAALIKQTKAQVVVDLTVASAGYSNFITIVDAGAHPVVGTSGFTKDQVAILSELCRKAGIGALIAPNFSIGAMLMMKFSQEAAKYMAHAEIIETHHPQKADAPSGTAIRTAELIAEAISNKKDSGDNSAMIGGVAKGDELVQGARGGSVSGISVHSVRMPGVIAQQRVVFGDNAQTLVIEHTSTGRESFMDGIRLACKRILGTRELFYGLETLLWP